MPNEKELMEAVKQIRFCKEIKQSDLVASKSLWYISLYFEMDSVDTKRNRSSNFAKEEELQLLEEIEKYRDIVECKTSNKISLQEKV